MNKKKYSVIQIILFALFLIVFLYWGIHTGKEWSAQENCDNIISALVYGIISIIKEPLSFPFVWSIKTLYGVLASLAIYAIILFLLHLDTERSKHYEGDDACGSAKWNDNIKEYNKRYSDPYDAKESNGPNNMILSHNVRLNMNCYQTQRNNNILIIGGAGTGKSRGVIKPNILQANCNYVVTDPKGELLKSTGKFLEDEGYEVKVFNLVEMDKSDHYNPFEYIRDENGVLMMIKCLMVNTTPPNKQSGDPFWERAEENLFLALAFYLYYHCEKKHRNFSKIMELLRLAEVDERDATKKSALDRLFDKVEQECPDSIAVKRYKSFKSGAGKTMKSILISCSSRLTVFDFEKVKNLTSEDDLHLEEMGEGKKALFVIIPSADSTFNFLVSMMYNQMFETLYHVAETKTDSPSLDRDVRFLADEFSNTGEIPNFDRVISTCRQYRISISIVLQDLSQLKAKYKETMDTIIGNCDTTIFLGSKSLETAKYISDSLGDSTIIVRDKGHSYGKSKSSSQNYKTSKRKLMPPEEVLRMPEQKCVVMVRGVDPFLDKKYDYTKHPNYIRTGDANKSNIYVNNRNNAVKSKNVDDEIKELREKEELVSGELPPLPPSDMGSPSSIDTPAETPEVTVITERMEEYAAAVDDEYITNYVSLVDEYAKTRQYTEAETHPEDPPIGEIKDFAEASAERGYTTAEEVKENIEVMPITTVATEEFPPPKSNIAGELEAMRKVINEGLGTTGAPTRSKGEDDECWDFDNQS